MITKVVKRSIIGLVVLGVAGGFLLGGDMLSYVSSTRNAITDGVKDAIPVEFELRRAQDLLDDIIPEMHANQRRIVEEEIEVIALQEDIENSEVSLVAEKVRIEKLRNTLTSQFASYQFGRHTYTRTELVDDLNRRFELYKNAKESLDWKNAELAEREKTLSAAREHLNAIRSRKELLAIQIEGLEGKHRMIQASAAGSGIVLDNSKLAQTEKLLKDIKKRLDKTERMLAYDGEFTQPLDLDEPIVSEVDLIESLDNYFAPKAKVEIVINEEYEIGKR
ncbi:MAG: hypothetical protein GY869_25195 [Planctomycetes bacterium]|nr:hypothetical protein [Planctomycetota bacterium]